LRWRIDRELLGTTAAPPSAKPGRKRSRPSKVSLMRMMPAPTSVLDRLDLFDVNRGDYSTAATELGLTVAGPR